MTADGISLVKAVVGDDRTCGCSSGVLMFADSLGGFANMAVDSEEQCNEGADGGAEPEYAESDLGRRVVCGSKCPQGQLPLFGGVCRPLELTVEGNKDYPIKSGDSIDLKLHVSDSWGTNYDNDSNKWSKKSFTITTAEGDRRPEFCFSTADGMTEAGEQEATHGGLSVKETTSEGEISSVAEVTGKAVHKQGSDVSKLWVQATMEVEYASGADTATATIKSPCIEIAVRPGATDFALHEVATISGVSGLAVKNANQVFAVSQSMHTLFAVDLSLSFDCDAVMADQAISGSFKAWVASADERVNQWPPAAETFQFQPHGDPSRWYVNAYKKTAARTFAGVDTELTKQLLCFQEVTNDKNKESCCVIKNLNIPEGDTSVSSDPEARAALKAW